MENSEHEDDRTLLRALGAGDRAAAGRLYERYAGPAYSLALLITGDDEEEAELLTGDLFAALWRHADLLAGSDGRLFTWLWAVLQQEAGTLGASPPRKPSWDTGGLPGRASVGRVFGPGRAEKLLEAVRRLDRDQRRRLLEETGAENEVRGEFHGLLETLWGGPLPGLPALEGSGWVRLVMGSGPVGERLRIRSALAGETGALQVVDELRDRVLAALLAQAAPADPPAALRDRVLAGMGLALPAAAPSRRWQRPGGFPGTRGLAATAAVVLAVWVGAALLLFRDREEWREKHGAENRRAQSLEAALAEEREGKGIAENERDQARAAVRELQARLSEAETSLGEARQSLEDAGRALAGAQEETGMLRGELEKRRAQQVGSEQVLAARDEQVRDAERLAAELRSALQEASRNLEAERGRAEAAASLHEAERAYWAEAKEALELRLREMDAAAAASGRAALRMAERMEAALREGSVPERAQSTASRE